MRNLLRCACALAVLFAASCNSQKKNDESMAMMNSKCPVSGEAIDASSPTCDYMGGKVGFCCEKCIAKWNAMDEASKKQKVDAAR